VFYLLGWFAVLGSVRRSLSLDPYREFRCVEFRLLFCSCVESYLQTTGWPYPCESDGEEPVKKKPRHTQVCYTLNVLLIRHFAE